MSEQWWMACCGQEARGDVERAVRLGEPDAKLVFTRDAAALRETLASSGPGRFAVAVGPSSEGVSDINLAAAVARDGGARKVLLVGRGLSGSLRSRARRAGISEVVDLETCGQATVRQQLREVPLESDSARVAAAEDVSAPACGEGHPVAGGTRAEEGSAPRQMGAAARETSPILRKRTLQDGMAPVVTISSGRGGVGKTTLSALMALVAASWGMRVALVDLDLSGGNLFTLFGIARPPALDAGLGKVREATGTGGDQAQAMDALVALGVTVAQDVTLWGPCERPEMAEKVTPQVAPLLERLSRDHDLVLVDTPTTCTDAVAQAFQGSDRLLLVHDENLVAVGSLSRMAALAVRLGVARTQIVRVANWGDRRVRFDLTVGRGEPGLETARAFRLLAGGSEVVETLAAGKVAELVEAGADPVPQVTQALARILDDLGRLPDSEVARAELDGSAERARGFQLFRRKAS